MRVITVDASPRMGLVALMRSPLARRSDFDPDCSTLIALDWISGVPSPPLYPITDLTGVNFDSDFITSERRRAG